MKPKSVLSELKEKERKVRRDIIIAAAEEEFAEKPFDKVSMRTIAKCAGISSAIIYQHFPDQLEKLMLIEKNILDHLDVIFCKMKVKGDVRVHSHTLFAAITGIVVTFRNHPAKSSRQVLKKELHLQFN